MILCKQCKFWGLPSKTGNNWSKGLKNHRSCGSDKFIYESAFFNLADVERSIPLDAVGYRDGEGYQADLWTGAEFGCIHGKAKGEKWK